MKRSRSNEIKAGIFVLLASLLLVGMMLRVSGTLDHFTRETYRIHAHFGNTMGITSLSKVTLKGVKVGRVKELRMVEHQDASFVEVVLELDREQARLYEDATAMITAETLLSEKHIDLTPGTPGRRILGEGDTITGSPSADINATLLKMDDTVAALRDLLADELLQDNIRGMVTDARVFITNLNQLSGNLDDIINENAEKISAVLDNVQAGSQNIHDISLQIKEAIDRTQKELHNLIGSIRSVVEDNRTDIRSTVSDIQKSSEVISTHIEGILEDLRLLSGQMNQLVGDNQDGVRRAVQNLELTSENARLFSRQLADYPWQLVYPTQKRRDVRALYPEWKPVSNLSGEQLNTIPSGETD